MRISTEPKVTLLANVLLKKLADDERSSLLWCSVSDEGKKFRDISVSASLQVSTVVPAATLVNWKRTDLLVFKTIPKIYFLYSLFVTKKTFFFEKI